MKAQSWNTHALFECMTCGKRWEYYMNAREQAYSHAKATGHDVSGEVGRVYYYTHPTESKGEE